jgi:hypothetical protein
MGPSVIEATGNSARSSTRRELRVQPSVNRETGPSVPPHASVSCSASNGIFFLRERSYGKSQYLRLGEFG